MAFFGDSKVISLIYSFFFLRNSSIFSILVSVIDSDTLTIELSLLLSPPPLSKNILFYFLVLFFFLHSYCLLWFAFAGLIDKVLLNLRMITMMLLLH